MSLIEAVYVVLKDAGMPLKPEEILARVFQKNLWQTTGKTPLATLTARLYVDIKKQHPSRFMKMNDGRFGLSGQVEKVENRQKEKPISKPPTETPNQKTYSFTDCAEKVLRMQSPRRSMAYSEIVKIAIENGWLVTAGKTPEATLSVQIMQDIKRAREHGRQPRFQRCGKGLVALAGDTTALETIIKQHYKDVRRSLRENLMKLSPENFEKLVMKLFQKMGFEEVSRTKLSGDGGIDVRGRMVANGVISTKYAIQVKRWKNNVQAPIVQQVRGSLGANEQGCIVTTSDFSSGAKEEANKPDKSLIALINGETLIDLLIKNQVGVRRVMRPLYELKKDFGLDDEEDILDYDEEDNHLG